MAPPQILLSHKESHQSSPLLPSLPLPLGPVFAPRRAIKLRYAPVISIQFPIPRLIPITARAAGCLRGRKTPFIRLISPLPRLFSGASPAARARASGERPWRKTKSAKLRRNASNTKRGSKSLRLEGWGEGAALARAYIHTGGETENGVSAAERSGRMIRKGEKGAPGETRLGGWGERARRRGSGK